MDLSHTLQKYRHETGQTQKEVASRLRISREYYAMLEEGHAEPSPRLLHILEHELGVLVEFHLKGNIEETSP
jgi:transcriptional regulator with XRE-family HTH domain